MLRRAARRGWPYEPLPRNQLELLRLADQQPGITVAGAAAALALAPNTVSTLVNQLGRAGLLLRTPDEHDGRVAHLAPTESGAARLTAWRDRRAELLEAALGELSGSERDALYSCLPALEHLTQALEKENR